MSRSVFTAVKLHFILLIAKSILHSSLMMRLSVFYVFEMIDIAVVLHLTLCLSNTINDICSTYTCADRSAVN